jgi:predicted ATPase
MLKRIHIKNYKSMRETEVHLQPLTVVFGPNSVGKSNLFDAINLIARMVSEKSLKDAFSNHRGLPLESVNQEYTKTVPDDEAYRMQFEVDVILSPKTIESVETRIRMLRKGLEDNETHKETKIITNPHLRYKVEIEVLPTSGEVRVCDERLVALKQNAPDEKSRNAFLEKTTDKKKVPKLSLRLEGQSRPTLFDIGMNHTVVSTELYAPHYPHITALKEEMKRCHIYYFEPRELMRAASAIADVERPGPHGEDLATFYHTLMLRSVNQFNNLRSVAKTILPRLEDISIDRTSNKELFLSIKENGGNFSNRLISEGTLRVLGLVAVMSPTTGSTVIGYEEPENGVHPRRLNAIAELLLNVHSEDRQVLVNTHSPILPTYFKNDFLMICRREHGQTVFDPFNSLGPLYKSGEIDAHLNDRIERGDFGG